MQFKTALWMAGIVAILILIPTGILFWQNQKLKQQVAQYASELNINHQTLTKSLQRAETKIARNNDELERFAIQHGINIKAVKTDLETINGRLEAVASTEAKTITVVHNHHPSDSEIPSEVEVPTCKEDGRPIDVHGYTKRVETRELSDSNRMRVADVSFSAARERPWSSTVYGLKYKILNTVGRGEGGQVILSTELTAENPQIQPGEIFRIEGVESRVLQAPEPSPEFAWWSPALYLIGNLAVIAYDEVDFSASLSIGFSAWAYGSNWRFLGLTIGYDAFQNSFRASIVPVLYNIGAPLPFFSDLFLGLDIGLSHRLEVSVGFVIGTRL